MSREPCSQGACREVAEGDDDADMIHVVAASAATSFGEGLGRLVVATGANPDVGSGLLRRRARHSPVPRDRRAPNTGEARPSDAEEPTNPDFGEVPRSTLPDTPVSSSSHAHAPARARFRGALRGRRVARGRERIRRAAIGRLLVRKRILGLDELEKSCSASAEARLVAVRQAIAVRCLHSRHPAVRRLSVRLACTPRHPAVRQAIAVLARLHSRHPRLSSWLAALGILPFGSYRRPGSPHSRHPAVRAERARDFTTDRRPR